jgi:hypothetical protein
MNTPLAAKDAQIKRLQTALQETQVDLIEALALSGSVLWLVGALKYIADGKCGYGLDKTTALEVGCACYPCTARGALLRYQEKRPLPTEGSVRPPSMGRDYSL